MISLDREVPVQSHCRQRWPKKGRLRTRHSAGQHDPAPAYQAVRMCDNEWNVSVFNQGAVKISEGEAVCVHTHLWMRRL